MFSGVRKIAVGVNSRNVLSRNMSLRNMVELNYKVATKRGKFYSSPVVGAENPTYLKEPTDKFLFAFGMGAIGMGIATILKGLYSMANGINKEE